MFLLIGFEVKLTELLIAWRPIVLAFVAVTFGRAVVVALVSFVLKVFAPKAEHLSFSHGLVLTWGGLRGALSMVLALAIPATFPERQLVVTTTFGVVVLSIVLQGLTAGPLLRKLRIVGA